MRRWRVVIRGYHDYRSRTGEKLSRIGALLRVARHPAHLALIAARKPLFQMRTFRRQSFRTRDSYRLKSELRRVCFDPRGDLSAEVGRIHLLTEDRHRGQYSKGAEPLAVASG